MITWRGALTDIGPLFAAAPRTYAIEVWAGNPALFIYQRDRLAQRYPPVVYEDVPIAARIGDGLSVEDGRLVVTRRS